MKTGLRSGSAALGSGVASIADEAATVIGPRQATLCSLSCHGTIQPMADYTVVVRCSVCKGEDHIQLQGYGEKEAKDFAALLDGTSPFFVASPRAPDAITIVSRCVQCGGIIDAEVIQA